MSIRGKKPDPTALRILKGNPQKKPLPKDEPHPPLLPHDDLPREIVDDEVATREWLRLAPMLRTVRILTEADRAALIALVLEWSRYMGLQSDGSHRGYRERRWALQSCIRLWTELGLTPSSRARVTTVGMPAPGGDSFSEFDGEEETGATH